MGNLSEIYALIDSGNENDVQLGLIMWSGIDKAAHDTFVSEWQAWADLFGMSLCWYLANHGRLVINCASNELTELPAIPSTLQILYCQNNQLTALPALPSTLQRLDCENNQLTVLPALPSTLQELYCYNNQLTVLPALPPTLQILYCQNNYLTEEPKVPEGCELLFYTQKQRTKAV